MESLVARKLVEPDFLYWLDVAIANRRDGGTVSDSMAEMTGISKSALHAGMVGTAGLAATAKVFGGVRHPVARLAAVAAFCLLGKAVYDYMEAPRRR